MKTKRYLTILFMLLLFLGIFALPGCRPSVQSPASSSGVKKATVKVKTMSNGLTVEQNNIRERLKMDNKPGSIKHLYLVNNDGDCILYSTVKGKVTSSGKRLTPYQVTVGGTQGQYGSRLTGFGVKLGSKTYETGEVLQDDGTYGSSDKYIYWWDHRGQYFQYMKSMSLSVILSDKPVRVYKPKVILSSME